MSGARREAGRARPQRRELIKKVCIVGDSGVGKNTIAGIVAPFEKGMEKYVARIGAAVTKYGAEFQIGAQKIRLIILVWDVTGRSDYGRLWPSYYAGAEGFIVVADASMPASIVGIPLWIEAARRAAGGAPIVVVVNKTDLISDEELASLRLQLARSLTGLDTPLFFVNATSSPRALLKAPFRELAGRMARLEAQKRPIS